MLADLLSGYEILLASKSPRRHYLLTELGIPFKQISIKDVDETYPEDMLPDEIPQYLAGIKANAYKSYLKPESILVTADTIVVLNNKVIGKPDGKKEAAKMLSQLSGNMHEVFTGVCLKTSDKQKIFSARTKVFFRDLKQEEIEYYIEIYKPLDKAGAYGIQEWIGYIGIEKIEGSYFNVMGLPVQKLYTELIEFVK